MSTCPDPDLLEGYGSHGQGVEALLGRVQMFLVFRREQSIPAHYTHFHSQFNHVFNHLNESFLGTGGGKDLFGVFLWVVVLEQGEQPVEEDVDRVGQEELGHISTGDCSIQREERYLVANLEAIFFWARTEREADEKEPRASWDGPSPTPFSGMAEGDNEDEQEIKNRWPGMGANH